MKNFDFEEFINNNISSENLIFLDPPYYIDSKLYGNKGDLHSEFSHEKLYDCIAATKKNWIITYNNCEYIKNLYKKFTIIETNWTYGMNKSKKSSEIVIINFG
jgi:DNA adenine methylase